MSAAFKFLMHRKLMTAWTSQSAGFSMKMAILSVTVAMRNV